MHTIAVRMLPGVNTKGSWKSPILLASVVAVALRLLNIPVPAWIIETARMLGAVTVPLMLLSLGHALALIPSNGVRDGAKVAAIRLVVGLATGGAVVWALNLEPVLAGALTLQMAMPCAVVSYMYARRYTPLGDTAAGAVLVGLIEAFSSFWASAYKEVIVFTLIIPVLVWRSFSTHHADEEE